MEAPRLTGDITFPSKIIVVGVMLPLLQIMVQLMESTIAL